MKIKLNLRKNAPKSKRNLLVGLGAWRKKLLVRCFAYCLCAQIYSCLPRNEEKSGLKQFQKVVFLLKILHVDFSGNSSQIKRLITNNFHTQKKDLRGRGRFWFRPENSYQENSDKLLNYENVILLILNQDQALVFLAGNASSQRTAVYVFQLKTKLLSVENYTEIQL